MKKAFIMAGVIALAGACTSVQKAATLGAGSKWNVVWVSGFNGEINTVKQAFVQVGDDAASFHSSTGCNVLNGGLTIEGATVKFAPGPMTKVYCEDGGFEQAFVASLLGTDAYAINGDTLTLSTNGNESMKLVRTTAEAAAEE